MPRKKKNELPSGNFRVQVRYTDENGKSQRKSFTAPSRSEAEFKANYWRLNHDYEKKTREGSVQSMIDSYIDMKEPVLSPSTVREYRNRAKSDFEMIGMMKHDELTNADIQKWVSELSKKKSPKTVRNIYGLLTAALDFTRPDFRVKVTLPAKQKKQLYTPSDNDVKYLISYLKEKEHTDLLVCVLLAAFGPLRRSEIAALTMKDVSGNRVTVNKAMVMSEGGFVIKPTPKTYSSNRVVEMPQEVIDVINSLERSAGDRIVQITPDQITHRFQRALKYSRSTQFRFHDLRHYSASILHAIGVPDKYIQERGGWSSDNVLKTVYQSTIDAETAKQTANINSHFSTLLKK